MRNLLSAIGAGIAAINLALIVTLWHNYSVFEKQMSTQNHVDREISFDNAVRFKVNIGCEGGAGGCSSFSLGGYTYTSPQDLYDRLEKLEKGKTLEFKLVKPIITYDDYFGTSTIVSQQMMDVEFLQLLANQYKYQPEQTKKTEAKLVPIK